MTAPTRAGYAGRCSTGSGTWSTTTTRTLASGSLGATGGARPWCRVLWGRGQGGGVGTPEDAHRAEDVPEPPVGRRFPKSSALTLQERTHSNKRPCQGRACSKTFMHKSTLVQPGWIHTERSLERQGLCAHGNLTCYCQIHVAQEVPLVHSGDGSARETALLQQNPPDNRQLSCGQ